MPSLSWNEIRQRAIAFSHDFKGTTEERAEAQSFWYEFFHVFGIKRRTVASFEEPVKSMKNTKHRIDLFWKGTLLAEHKSAGQSLEKAGSQAVLDARQSHLDNGATLADLYDPLYMPAPLSKAHQNLDRAVDRCYRKDRFETER